MGERNWYIYRFKWEAMKNLRVCKVILFPSLHTKCICNENADKNYLKYDNDKFSGPACIATLLLFITPVCSN